MEESEAKPETCGPPPRAYKGASPTPREGKANAQRHREAMTAGARVSGRCARDRSRMAGIRQAEPGSREPGARHRRAGALATSRTESVLAMEKLRRFKQARRRYLQCLGNTLQHQDGRVSNPALNTTDVGAV